MKVARRRSREGSDRSSVGEFGGERGKTRGAVARGASKQLADECAHTLSKVERLLSELDIGEGVSVGVDVDKTASTEDVLATVVVRRGRPQRTRTVGTGV